MGLKVALRSLLGAFLLVNGATPAWSELHPIPFTSKQRCNHKLAAAKDIPHVCWQHQNDQAKLPVWRSALGFEFGTLTRSQWQQLQQTYTRWQNRRLAPYDPQRSYTLMDFMPPLMQALNAHQFHVEKVPLPTPLPELLPSKDGVASAIANCWGTLYEVLRTAQHNQSMPYTFMAGPQQIEAWLQQASTPVIGAAQPGDILLIQHRRGDLTYLDHVALVIDDQLFFEKAGTGDETPYRLVDLKTLQQSWRPDVFAFKVRRPLQNQALLSPQKRFGLHSPATLKEFPELARVKRSLAAQFSVVWFKERHLRSVYFYPIQPILLQEVTPGRFTLVPSP
ncbi:MAG: hypothetical protein GFH24_608438n31 [Chloroflexi bacterium AL-N5]|nr:hypothetical protein [Chloroflexi bacterium AL-N5]